MNSAPFAHQGYPVIYRATLASVDVSGLVSSIQGLTQSLDVLEPTVFQTGDVMLTLINAADWSPQKPDNLFVANGYDQTGVLAPVILQMGFSVDGTEHLDVIFEGTLDTVSQDIKPNTLLIRVSDGSQRIRTEDITDFGLTKHLTLEETEQTEHGQYEFPSPIAPVSDESLSGTGLTIREFLETEGDLDPTNVHVSPDRLETEGGFLPNPPQVTLKAPYRWRSIDVAIQDILSATDITDTEIDVPDITIDTKHITTLGRFVYQILNADTTAIDTPFRWDAYITGMAYLNGTLYCLYSHRNTDVNPRLIAYHLETDTVTEVVKFTTHAEWWQLIVTSTHFYILGTSKSSSPTTPVRGSYDASETGTQTKIWRVNRTSNNVFTWVDGTTAIFKPQLAQYYHFGFTPDGANNNVRQGIRPDSRAGFLIHDNRLYFRFANATHFGVRRKHLTSGVERTEIQFSKDDSFSHAGLNFTISDGVLYVGVCFLRGNRSHLEVYKKDL